MNKQLFQLAVPIAVLIAGCATPPATTQQDEIESLHLRVAMLSATVATGNEALAKKGMHMVVPGDTLYKIAKNNGIDVKELLRMNPELKYGERGSWKVGIVLTVKQKKVNEASEAN